MRKTFNLLLMLLFALPVALWADDDKDNMNKYLAGAVPMVDGKVTFKTRLEVPLSKAEIYSTILNYCDKHFVRSEKFPQAAVVLKKESEGEIAAMGDEYLVFSSSALSLDRSRIYYQLHALCSDGTCDLSMSRIRYWYDENRNGGQKYKAEEWITDEQSLNKNKDKLSKLSGKFRRKTIDLKDELFDGIESALANQLIKPQKKAENKVKSPKNDQVRVISAPAVETPPVPTTTVPNVKAATETITLPSSAMQGYKEIGVEQIPSKLMDMLSKGQMTIAVGTKEKFSSTASTNGLMGRLFNKPVFTCFVNPAQPIYLMMEKATHYTLSFSADASVVNDSPMATPDGNVTFKGATLIIECQKILAQSLNTDALKTDELNSQWVGKVMDKMYIGEILHIWMK